MTLRPVTRQDLPYFEVVTIEREAVDSPGEPSAPGPWKLSGLISDARVVSPGHWSVLERIGGDCVTAYWDPVEGAGDKVSFHTPDLPEDIYVGCRLTYLSWNGKLHAKLVEDGPSAWTAKMFQPVDAVEAPFVDDEGKQWKQLRVLAEGEAIPESARVVAGGWDHEHCMICNESIGEGEPLFQHEEAHEFLCAACYEKYVPMGDLSFLWMGGLMP